MKPESSRRQAALISGAVLLASAVGIALFAVTPNKPAALGAVWIATTPAHDAARLAPREGAEVAALDTELAALDVQQPTAHDDSPSVPDLHPHPITPEHERLRRERAFVQELNQAIDFRDGLVLREALDAYRRQFPQDEQRLQQGYGIIADCLTVPGDAGRAAARRFYDAQRGSSLRRWVRRVCLDS
jgi:hypothetical protein